MAGPAPKVGAILSIVGGVFILIGGIIYAIAGAILALFVGPIASILFLGVPIAILILVFAVLLLVAPRLKVVWGALIVVLAFASLVFDFFGGFVLGFLLCLIGGLLAIFHKAPMAAPGWSAAPRCPACGGVVDVGRRVCTQCGRAV